MDSLCVAKDDLVASLPPFRVLTLILSLDADRFKRVDCRRTGLGFGRPFRRERSKIVSGVIPLDWHRIHSTASESDCDHLPVDYRSRIESLPANFVRANFLGGGGNCVRDGVVGPPIWRGPRGAVLGVQYVDADVPADIATGLLFTLLVRLCELTYSNIALKSTCSTTARLVLASVCCTLQS